MVVSLKWWYPQSPPQNERFLVRKPMVVGETHHFRKPLCTMFFHLVSSSSRRLFETHLQLQSSVDCCHCYCHTLKPSRPSVLKQGSDMMNDTKLHAFHALFSIFPVKKKKLKCLYTYIFSIKLDSLKIFVYRVTWQKNEMKSCTPANSGQFLL